MAELTPLNPTKPLSRSELGGRLGSDLLHRHVEHRQAGGDRPRRALPARVKNPAPDDLAGGPARAAVPAVDADLEVAALGPRRTQVSINARYRPPIGMLGRAVDRAMLHCVAEATIKDFLDRVGERVCPRVPSVT